MTKGYLIALRTVISVQTVAVFAAAVAAGLLLSIPGGKAVHSGTAYTLFVVAVLHALIAAGAWWRGGGTGRAAGWALAFLVGVSAQVVFGIAHLTALHVPFGVLLFGASTVQLIGVWMTKPGIVDIAEAR